MDYSIKPETHELEKAREKLDTIITSYSHAFEVENVEFYLSWQKYEKSSTFTWYDEDKVGIIIDPEKNWEQGLEETLVNGLCHIEFVSKAGFDQIDFTWQEVLLFAYAEMKTEEITGQEPPKSDEVEKRWSEIRAHLLDEKDGLNEFLYSNTGIVGSMIGRKLLEDHELEEFPELTRSDVVGAGDGLFR